MITLTYDLSTIDAAAQKILDRAKNCSIITLTGSLGAGKTTLTQALLKHLKVTEPVISPTFTYVNQYQTESGLLIYHFDLYRLKNLQDFVSAGFCEYLYQSNSLAIIEWPEIVQPLLQRNVLKINIESQGAQSRILVIKEPIHFLR